MKADMANLLFVKRKVCALNLLLTFILSFKLANLFTVGYPFFFQEELLTSRLHPLL